jgi:dephospho-CoA kinase
MKPVIGLVGGIGSGKSRVAAEFARHGARVVSGDVAGHEALLQPEIRARVAARWAGVLNDEGEIDRRKLGAVVFGDPAERHALEAIVFPWITGRLREQIAAAQDDPAVRLVLLDAAVMLEAGWNKACDRLVYVHTPRAVRLRRLAQTRGWSPESVAARERAQLPLTDKVSRADFALDNSGTPEELARQVDALVRVLRPWGRLPTCRLAEEVS